MKSTKTNTTKILFAAILVLQLVCMFFYANAKQGYFVDAYCGANRPGLRSKTAAFRF